MCDTWGFLYGQVKWCKETKTDKTMYNNSFTGFYCYGDGDGVRHKHVKRIQKLIKYYKYPKTRTKRIYTFTLKHKRMIEY